MRFLRDRFLILVVVITATVILGMSILHRQINRGIQPDIVPESISLVVQVPAPSRESAPVPTAGKININTASVKELDTLPYIGYRRAQAIIAGRPYASIEEITKIRGIGPKTYQKFKDFIIVSGDAPPAPSWEPVPVESPVVEEKPVEVKIEEVAPPAKTPSLVMEKIDTDGDGIPDTFIIKGEPGKKPVSLAKAKTKKPKHLIEEKPDNLIKATCIGVSDGDTIKVRLDDDSVENVRLYGVDCPEKQQSFGREATQFTKSMVLGKTVNISPVNNDTSYGRTIAWVYVDGKCLDKELLKAGLAWHYKEYSEEEELAILEEEARAKKIGLWQEPNPTPPWEWRHSR